MKTTSVIVPVFNGFQWCDSIVESIEGSLELILEVILVNDGDQEDFLKLCDALKRMFGGLIVCCSVGYRTGPANARNKGISLAKGKYIAFLDCDDLWLPGSLKKRLSVLIAKPESSFVYGSFINRDVNSGRESINYVPNITYKEDLYFTNHICLPTVIVAASKLKRIGFNPVKHEDLDLWLRLLSSNSPIAFGGKDVGVVRRIGFDSVSANKLQSSTWHFNVIKRHMNGVEYCFIPMCMALYLLNGLLKRKKHIYRPLYFGMNKIMRRLNGVEV